MAVKKLAEAPPRPKPAPKANPSTNLEVADVLADFTADGVRYTVRQSLMTGAIDRQVFVETGMPFERIWRALQSDDNQALWMVAALAFVAQRQAGVVTTFAEIEQRFPYDRPIRFEWWPPTGDAPPEA